MPGRKGTKTSTTGAVTLAVGLLYAFNYGCSGPTAASGTDLSGTWRTDIQTITAGGETADFFIRFTVPPGSMFRNQVRACQRSPNGGVAGIRLDRGRQLRVRERLPQRHVRRRPRPLPDRRDLPLGNPSRRRMAGRELRATGLLVLRQSLGQVERRQGARIAVAASKTKESALGGSRSGRDSRPVICRNENRYTKGGSG